MQGGGAYLDSQAIGKSNTAFGKELGGNGAGKSTTLKTISSLVPARSGSVIFEGKNITYAEPHAIVEMGVIHVPEGRMIFKELTVLENLELGSYTLK